MPTDDDQDPDDHKAEFYPEDDGRRAPDFTIFFRGKRRKLSSLTDQEVRCALYDAHNDLLQSMRSFTRIDVMAEGQKRITDECARGDRFASRHQATQR
jgi:hypothetical protein